MVVICSRTHAVKLYLVQGYSTEDFLLAWTHHTLNWRVPLTVYTDKGTQLGRKEVMTGRRLLTGWE